MQYIKAFLQNKYLITIFLVGLILRFYKLSQIPNGFYVDEAMIGYNAYSFLQTGKDEYGKYFPIFLRSYSVFSPPLYSYLTAIFIKLFGLNIFSIRFLSALSGSLSIIAIYYLCESLFKNKFISISSALIFAISPWSIFFSRGAFEVNLSVFILLLSLCFLLKNNLYWGAILLAVNTYAYHSQRLISILLIILFSLLNIKKLRKLIFANLIFAIILIPQILLITTPAFSARASGLFYTDRATSLFTFLREFFAQYVNYFSPNNLFIRGDQDLQRSIPELSTYYSWLLIPYLIGIYNLFKNFKQKNYLILLSLFLIFPIIPALTKDPFSTLRNLSSIIPITIIMALGINYIYTKFNKYLFAFLSITCLIFSFLYLWRSYFVLFPYERATAWNYGYEDLAEIIKNSPESNFVIDNSRIKPPYILLAFHMKLDPKILQDYYNPHFKKVYYTNLNWDPNYKLANFETRSINWQEDIYKEQILVGDEWAISETQAKEHFLEKEFEIWSPNKEIIFRGYKTNPEKKCEATNHINKFCIK